MSREIKFRVWQPEERRMLFNCSVQRQMGGYLSGFGVPAGAGVDDIGHFARHDSVMQFTGLRDKNGIEI
ncbi:YopX protein [Rathayibacter sp. PhB151]|nr:YopX protein [Rathayibacter sp. PhB151]